VSGNPGGKLKGSLSIVDALERALSQEWVVPKGEPDAGATRTKLDGLCRAMVGQALAGSVPAAQWVTDRVWGKPVASVDVTSHQEGGPRVVVVPWLPAEVDPATGRPLLPGQTGGVQPWPGSPEVAGELGATVVVDAEHQEEPHAQR
jgi:hypothetical protein